jgi:HK97 family phage prohead protease
MEETKIIRRCFEARELRTIDQELRTVEFVASDNSVDSYGTILPVDKWDLSRYKRNGIVGYMHDVYGDSWTKAADPDDVIGKGEAFVENDQLIVRITFEPADLNEKADKIFRKLIFGSLHAVSVGFKPTAKGHMGDEERGEDPNVYYYNGQELLEVSVVNIPSNPNALMRSIEEERKNWEFEEREIKPSEAPAPDPAEEDIDNTISITARARALLAKNV